MQGNREPGAMDRSDMRHQEWRASSITLTWDRHAKPAEDKMWWEFYLIRGQRQQQQQTEEALGDSTPQSCRQAAGFLEKETCWTPRAGSKRAKSFISYLSGTSGPQQSHMHNWRVWYVKWPWKSTSQHNSTKKLKESHFVLQGEDLVSKQLSPVLNDFLRGVVLSHVFAWEENSAINSFSWSRPISVMSLASWMNAIFSFKAKTGIYIHWEKRSRRSLESGRHGASAAINKTEGLENLSYGAFWRDHPQQPICFLREEFRKYFQTTVLSMQQ